MAEPRVMSDDWVKWADGLKDERDAALAELERVRTEAQTEAQVEIIELRSRLSLWETQAGILRGVIGRILRDPLMSREMVQGLLLNAAEGHDRKVGR